MRDIIIGFIVFLAFGVFAQAQDSTATVITNIVVNGTEPNITYLIQETNTQTGEVITRSFTAGTTEAILLQRLKDEYDELTVFINRTQERRSETTAAIQQLQARRATMLDEINNAKEKRRELKAIRDAILGN